MGTKSSKNSTISFSTTSPSLSFLPEKCPPKEYYPSTQEEYDLFQEQLMTLIDQLCFFPKDLMDIIVEYTMYLLPILQWDLWNKDIAKLCNEGTTLDHLRGWQTYRARPGWNNGRHVWTIQIDEDSSSGGIRLGFVTSDFPHHSFATNLLGDHKAAPGFWSASPFYDLNSFVFGRRSIVYGPAYQTGTILTFCLDLQTRAFYIDDLTMTPEVNFKAFLQNIPVKKDLFYYPAVSMCPNSKVTVKIVNEEK